MTYTVKRLLDSAGSCHAEINGKWVPARPLRLKGIYGFRVRLREAWRVLRDELDTVKWPEGQ